MDKTRVQSELHAGEKKFVASKEPLDEGSENYPRENWQLLCVYMHTCRVMKSAHARRKPYVYSTLASCEHFFPSFVYLLFSPVVEGSSRAHWTFRSRAQERESEFLPRVRPSPTRTHAAADKASTSRCVRGKVFYKIDRRCGEKIPRESGLLVGGIFSGVRNFSYPLPNVFFFFFILILNMEWSLDVRI